MFSLDSILVGLHTLRSNPLRTLLSTLGIIIGVAALVAVLSLGDSLEAFSRRQIEQTTDLKSISIAPLTTERVNGIQMLLKETAAFSPEDVDDLQSILGGDGRVTLTLTRSDWISVNPDSSGVAGLVIATLPDAEQAIEADPAYGRFLNAKDVFSSRKVAVLSSTAVDILAGSEGGAALIGQTVRTGATMHEIVGVLNERSGEQIPTVILPYSADNRERLEDVTHRANVVVRAERIEDVSRLRSRIDAWLGERFEDAGKKFLVSSSQQRVEQAARGMMVFKLALGSIAGISLLVGGIGIMNILLASVTERTREIGVRRAAGARRSHIIMQFLVESVTISAAGSAIGAAVGIGGAFLITIVIRRISEAPLQPVFHWKTVLFAAAVATAVGLIFGTYPARRAARIEPADAVRYE